MVLPFSLTQTDLSRLIGSSRESVNRQLRNFAARGLVSLESGDIEIIDSAGLDAICHSAEKEEA
jgi:CRP/FNR family cyclic AMP-dependent transcriptional regulator